MAICFKARALRVLEANTYAQSAHNQAGTIGELPVHATHPSARPFPFPKGRQFIHRNVAIHFDVATVHGYAAMGEMPLFDGDIRLRITNRLQMVRYLHLSSPSLTPNQTVMVQREMNKG